MIDPKLLDYCTDKQRLKLEKAIELNSMNAADKALGLTSSATSKVLRAVKKKAALSGYSPEHDMTNTCPDGFMVKGTSTLYKDDGSVGIQWVKTSVDKEQQEMAMQAAVEALSEDLKPYSPISKPEEVLEEHLHNSYVISDHHIGMLAIGEETGGENYNIKRSKELLYGAMTHLVNTSPSAKYASILVLGDFLHYDGDKNQTEQSGHHLDADTRYYKMREAAVGMLRHTINEALRRHDEVRVHIVVGNHDDKSAGWLRFLFKTVYVDEPRVFIDPSERNIHMFTFGLNMVCITHGDKMKMPQIPLIMATDFPKEWGETVYRVCHTGHVHHDHIKEMSGATCESHRVLCPSDRYAATHHFRSLQSMKCITLHCEYGEVGRQTFNPNMLKGQ